MMDGWYGGMDGGGWILISLLWIVLVVAIVWAVAQLLPRSGRREPETSRTPDARAILDERLGRGEIDIDTYDEVRATLEGTPRAPRPVGR